MKAPNSTRRYRVWLVWLGSRPHVFTSLRKARETGKREGSPPVSYVDEDRSSEHHRAMAEREGR